MKRARNLPKVSDAAWHGPIGEAVARIAPATEGDPVAVLFQTLALFGAMAGRGPHVVIGAKRHPAQIWPLIVGRTSTARKGTSLSEAKMFASEWSEYARGYVRGRVVLGLSSGEGLLTALGAEAPPAPKGKNGAEEPRVEAAAPDGKLTVAESEFVNVLSQFKREGNILGGVLRQMWDDGRGATMTKNPQRVEDTHLVVIGHVTPGELRKKLAESDVIGGTANRFLFCAVERPQLLPYEENREPLADLAERLGGALERARSVDRRFYRDRAADALWRDVYYALNADEQDGRLGAVLARGPAYTMRLALLYALADGAGAIGVEHLLAGLAAWHYAADSARAVFGTERRDDTERLAEYIASAHSRTATEIYNFFGRNKSRAELQAMVSLLVDRGDVGEDIDKATGGRPVTRFMWVGAPRDAVTELLEQHRFAHPSTP